MTIGRQVVLAAVLCGCAAEKQEARPVADPVLASDGPTVTAEQNDAIDSLFRRKAPQLQRCWQEEYARTQNRKVEGDITLQMLVTKRGQATQLKTVNSTIGVPAIVDCVVKEVASWVFPEGPGDAPYRRTVHLGAAF